MQAPYLIGNEHQEDPVQTNDPVPLELSKYN
jgi:hypothetical protein